MSTQVDVLFADLDGQTAKTSVYVAGTESAPEGGITAAFVALLQAMSGAKVYAVANHVQGLDSVGAAEANDYGAEDKLKVYGRSATGQDLETSIPGPNEDLFNADKETVDLTAGAGATLKAALEAIWKGTDGSAVTVVGAERVRPTRAL